MALPGEHPGGGQPAWASLPDELWVAVLAHVPPAARRSSVALTCRRFAALVDTPPLLADVHIAPRPRTELANRLRAFCRWLAPRAAHVRRLDFQLLRLYYDVQAALAAEVVACIAACAAKCTDLEELVIKAEHMPLPLGGWMGLPQQLRRLLVHGVASSAVQVMGSLETLTALEELMIDGAPLDDWDGGARLPASLTCLKLGNLTAAVGLPKLAGLTRLAHLRLGLIHAKAHAYHDLTALASVTRLTLGATHALPACFGRMTGLRWLQLTSVPDWPSNYNEQALEAALAPLTGLTRLGLLRMGYVSRLVPQAADGMRLRSMFLDAYFPGPRVVIMRSGAWHAGLRQLGLPAWVALRCGYDVLAAARQLEELELSWRKEGLPADQPMLDLLGSAAQHPTLRLLCLACPADIVPRELSAAIDATVQAKPGLQVLWDAALHKECIEPYYGSLV